MEDAVAIEKIDKLHGKEEYRVAVISLPNGTNSTKSLSRISKELDRFKEIVLCFDDDKAGRKAVADACQILPNALSVVLPCKDANDCVIQGKMKAAYKSFSFQGQKPKNSRIISAKELYKSARVPTAMGS